MRRLILCAVLTASCTSTGPGVNRPLRVSAEAQPTTATPTPEVVAAPVPVPSRASRSTPRHTHKAQRRTGATSGQRLSVTAYCWTGNRTASGKWPALGMAAGNRWPFGTRLRVEGWGTVTVEDRIGHGSELDLYMGREGCYQRAMNFGRRSLRVEVVR